MAAVTDVAKSILLKTPACCGWVKTILAGKDVAAHTVQKN